MHLVRTAVGAVHLVDDDDRAQAQLQRLAQHELGLRQRPFGGVAEQDHAVHHREDALDLAAEIGVAGGVHDVDAQVVPQNRRALGEDGDAALALQVVGVHGAFGDLLVLAKGTGLLEKLIDQGRLAVVNVRDDGDVTKIHVSGTLKSALGLPLRNAAPTPRLWAAHNKRPSERFRWALPGKLLQRNIMIRLHNASGVVPETHAKRLC